MQLRMALETEAIAALTARGERESFLDFGRRSLTYQKQALAISDLRSFYELDDEMHRAIIFDSGLLKFNHILDGVQPHLSRVRLLTGAATCVLGESLSEHQAIIDAIASGEATSAVIALRGHRSREIAELEDKKSKTEGLLNSGSTSHEELTAWAAELEETSAWEATLADGLEQE